MPTSNEIIISIDSELDVVHARQTGRELASSLGFSSSELTMISTAISEISRNIITYARRGTVAVKILEKDNSRGIQVVAVDEGPGIPDIDRVMKDGYSTMKGLGLGLPGAKRLMDEFNVVSEPGRGTTVTMAKWAR